MNVAEKYINDVLGNKINVGEAIRLQCKRHSDHFDKQDNPNFPYYFDADAAGRALSFAGICTFAKGRFSGQPFKLEGWQAAVMWMAYGWKKKETNTRKYRQIYVKVPRKNGKTDWLAVIGNYGWTLEGFTSPEKDPDIYWAATKKDQARIGWKRQKEQLRHLIKKSKKIASHTKILTHDITTTKGVAQVAYLGKDSDKDDGLSIYYGLIDEYHAHPSDDIYNIIQTSQGSRTSPMLWTISTAGFNPQSPCAQYEKRCYSILRGTISNENILPWIFDLDEGDDWHDPKSWEKVNPNLGVSVSMEYLESQYNDAVTMGADKEVNFKTKHLNMWTSTRVTFIQDKIYKANMGPIDMEELVGKVAYGGLDLASIDDTTAYCLYFPEQEGLEVPVAIWWAFMPSDNIRDRVARDGVPYRDWMQEGWITATPGNVTDYKYIKKTILESFEKYQIRSVGYDRWNSSQLVIDLLEEGLPFEKFGQGFGSMNAPTKEYQRLMRTGKILVGENPVARWQNSNISIEMNPAEDIKISKKKSSEKVDLMVALVMAIGEKMDKHKDNDRFDPEKAILWI